MSSTTGMNVPAGIMMVISLGRKCFPTRSFDRAFWFRCSVLGLTFFAYTLYHMSRKPISVVKSKLLYNCSARPDRPYDVDIHNDFWCDWAPFDKENATTLFGYLETYFLLAYAVAMFGSGYIAERVNLRYFLALGMILSGIATYLFGLARSLQIHSLCFFVLIQIFGGIVQTSGWPGVVTVVGNWFGKSKRGFIFGVWNSHTSLGNILGTLIAGFFVNSDWGLSFMIPGLLIGLGGILILFFLAPHPSVVGCASPHQTREPEESINRTPRRQRAQTSSDDSDSTPVGDVSNDGDACTSRDDSMESSYLLSKGNKIDGYHRNAIGFWGACRIPGVLEFSFSLFFTKFVNYTFLFWLPLYIKNTTTLDPQDSAKLSTLFDIGGIFGGILAGAVSDATGMSATTCGGMLIAAVPMLFIYQKYGVYNYYYNAVLLFITGLTVNGPYALITTAVSAELGTHDALEGNARALSTVTAIIDGTGSVGAAFGPFVAGLVAGGGSNWSNLFYVLMAANFIALLFLLRLVVTEYRRFVRTRPATWTA